MTTYMQGSEGKIIPPSQRPDGTWRKARRVKDGYVPQEEVPLYESKGKQFAQRRTAAAGPVPGIASTSHPQKPTTLTPPTTTHGPGLVIIKQSRPAKPKQPPQQAAGKSGKQGKGTATNHNTASSSNTAASSEQQLATQMERLGLSAEEEKDPEKLLKHVKKLRKKLREIDNIEQKIESGEIKTPDKDQLDKVARKQLIRIEVERLESNPLLPQAEALQQQKQQQQQTQNATSPPPT